MYGRMSSLADNRARYKRRLCTQQTTQPLAWEPHTQGCAGLILSDERISSRSREARGERAHGGPEARRIPFPGTVGMFAPKPVTQRHATATPKPPATRTPPGNGFVLRRKKHFFLSAFIRRWRIRLALFQNKPKPKPVLATLEETFFVCITVYSIALAIRAAGRLSALEDVWRSRCRLSRAQGGAF